MQRTDKSPSSVRRKKWARSNRERCWKRATLRAEAKEAGRAARPTSDQTNEARTRRMALQAIRSRLRQAKQTGDREGEDSARKELDRWFGIERPSPQEHKRAKRASLALAAAAAAAIPAGKAAR